MIMGSINSMGPRQGGYCCADNIFKRGSLNENICLSSTLNLIGLLQA